MAQRINEIIQPATLTPGGVAARIGIDRSTVFRWLERKVLPQPNIRAGRTVRWSTAAIDSFIEKGVQA